VLRCGTKGLQHKSRAALFKTVDARSLDGAILDTLHSSAAADGLRILSA